MKVIKSPLFQEVNPPPGLGLENLGDMDDPIICWSQLSHLLRGHEVNCAANHTGGGSGGLL